MRITNLALWQVTGSDWQQLGAVSSAGPRMPQIGSSMGCQCPPDALQLPPAGGQAGRRLPRPCRQLDPGDLAHGSLAQGRTEAQGSTALASC